MGVGQDDRHSRNASLAWPKVEDVVGDLTRNGIATWISSKSFLEIILFSVDVDEWPVHLPVRPCSFPEAMDVCRFLERNPCMVRQAWLASYICALSARAREDVDRYTNSDLTPRMAMNAKATLKEIMRIRNLRPVVHGIEVYAKFLKISSLHILRSMVYAPTSSPGADEVVGR